jgi:hypothetical protein
MLITRYHDTRVQLFVFIHLPWLLSELFFYHPVLSYSIAWLGSFFIFYISIFSSISFLSKDLPRSNQVMRPIILIQLIFAGFMCCTSIFFAIEQIFYAYDPDLHILAKCQRISVLAHSAIVTGMVIMTNSKPKTTHQIENLSISLKIKLAAMLYAAVFILNYIPGIIQFKYMLLCSASLLATHILISSLVMKDTKGFLFGVIIFLFNLATATTTGYKEIIIITFITILFIAYPYFKKTVLIISIPVTYIVLYLLPTFTTIIRIKSWKENKSVRIAQEQAYASFFNENTQDEILINNWEFLTKRFSEIRMFSDFVKSVPDKQPYYGFSIIENSFFAMIPRTLWNEKPITEKVAMERVYVAGVADRSSSVSAKSRPIVDGYLMAGTIGVYILMLLYGLITQKLCNVSEGLFGGYEMGCIVMFNGIFQPLWRGNNLEFLINNVFYGTCLLLIVFYSLKAAGLIRKIEANEHPTY